MDGVFESKHAGRAIDERDDRHRTQKHVGTPVNDADLLVSKMPSASGSDDAPVVAVEATAVEATAVEATAVEATAHVPEARLRATFDFSVDSAASQAATSSKLQSTKKVYASSLKKFRNFLLKIGDPHNAVDGNGIHANRLTARCVTDFLSEMEVQESSYTRVCAFSSAIKYLHEAQGISVPDSTAAAISKVRKEVLHDVSKQRQNGARAHVGGNPLPFEAYKALCSEILHTCTSTRCTRFVFGHTYLIMNWNLCCRSDIMQSINLNDLVVRRDACEVSVPNTTKTQPGAAHATKHVCNIFANPVTPEICPILSLGIYFAVNECNVAHDSSGSVQYPQLFPGSQQSSRFSQFLKRTLASVVTRDGSLPAVSTIGTASIRKGSTAHVVNSTSAGASHAPNSYVGRVRAGLPASSADFAVLPPQWKSEFLSSVAPWIPIAFGSYSQLPLLHPLLQRCLASLVFHRDFLRRTLPESHLLFHNRIFADASVMNDLSSKVVLPSQLDSSRRATGIPPHTIILRRLDELESKIIAAQAGPVVGPLAQQLAPLQDSVAKLQATLDAARPANTGTPPSNNQRQNAYLLPSDNRSAVQLAPMFWGPTDALHFLPQSFTIPGSLRMGVAIEKWFISAGQHDGYNLVPLRVVPFNTIIDQPSQVSARHLKVNVDTFARACSADMPRTLDQCAEYYKRMCHWMDELLSKARRMDDEFPPKKRLRQTCRVEQLGIRGFFNKVKELRLRELC